MVTKRTPEPEDDAGSAQWLKSWTGSPSPEVWSKLSEAVGLQNITLTTAEISAEYWSAAFALDVIHGVVDCDGTGHFGPRGTAITRIGGFELGPYLDQQAQFARLDPDWGAARHDGIERARKALFALPLEDRLAGRLLSSLRSLVSLANTLRHTGVSRRGRPRLDWRKKWLFQACVAFEWYVSNAATSHDVRRSLRKNRRGALLQKRVDDGTFRDLEEAVNAMPDDRIDHVKHHARRNFLRALAVVADIDLPDPDGELTRLLPSDVKVRRATSAASRRNPKRSRR
jgi:hypothetical protein